ncbi:related to beta-N-hexosaminidase [Cephalotrichum gorgonifer]|uniref:beta-N-acetylhexosaminidase n=1 Tax=Cephalotrichum gorgonifer TaxID=2041049 RepID=A0AAE8MX13_9PEZI|nr:related to beta-N-hexosaminidase [Cephalotrichum gorgonifer]
MLKTTAVLLTVLTWSLAWGEQGLHLVPPPPTERTDDRISPAASDGASSSWNVGSSAKTIYIEESLASRSDGDGLTLIPPSGYDFASLFRQDLIEITGYDWTIVRVVTLPDLTNSSGILLGSFKGDASSVTYENGKPTSEGYELGVTQSGAVIRGTGARGMWWGTRTLLQQILASNSSVPTVDTFIDAPAYATRGFMLDAGRKWYSADFLKDMCSFMSFFKMSEFHYHLSDNYPLNRGRNETWQDVYSHFSLLPEDESLLGILHGRENETLSRSDFADFQQYCASRGVTVIPEIEAPGHCLYLTKWKPELALKKKDLLDLTHPDTIPTVKRIWDEFLPWFETKEVHIGADEYDMDLAEDYKMFVEDLASHVHETADKRVRIWGTYLGLEFEKGLDIVVQHWQYGQSDPKELIKLGHEVINSEDWWAYTSIKNDHDPILPARYPQFFNEIRVLNFAGEDGWQWTPADFNPFNSSMQLDDDEILNRGSILAAWNDNGPDASTQLEAYYSMRRGIALTGARAWSGRRGPEVDEDRISSTIDFFSPLAPGQNLDRVLSEETISWTRSEGDGEEVCLGHGSKGMNYTLHLAVNGPFTLRGRDNTLSLDESGRLLFDADGWIYPLREVSQRDALELDPGHPGRIWANVTSSSHEEVTVATDTPVKITLATDVLQGTVVWVDGEIVGRFEVFVYGGRNTRFSWSQMAFAAPLETITGAGLQGLRLESKVNVPDPGTEI